MSDGEFEGNPSQDPDLSFVPKARHRSRGEGKLLRVIQDAPQIPGMEYYTEGELEAKNKAEGKGPNGTGIVSNAHLEEENLDQFTPPTDKYQQFGIDVDSTKTVRDALREQIDAKKRPPEVAAPTPVAKEPDIPFLDKVRSDARMQTGDLDLQRANELMRLKLLEQRLMGDENFMSASEYDEQRRRQVQAQVEADRLNRLRPKVQEEPQDEPGFFGRIARKLRGKQ